MGDGCHCKTSSSPRSIVFEVGWVFFWSRGVPAPSPPNFCFSVDARDGGEGRAGRRRQKETSGSFPFFPEAGVWLFFFF